jgi:DNA-binding GntR family transcriptional regulator
MRKTSKHQSLSDKAYKIIRNRILRGKLAMGETISRRTLGAELGMSLLPVMEALLRLEAEGLLESRARAGTRIRIPTEEDVQGHFAVREALEIQAAKLFFKNATPPERAAMVKLAVRVDESYGLDQVKFVALHLKFHHRLVECAHCPALLQAVEITHALWSTWLCALVPRLPVHSLGGRDHQELMAALVHGTCEAAAQKMEAHVRLGLRQVMDGLEPFFHLRKMVGETYSRDNNKHSEKLRQLHATTS